MPFLTTQSPLTRRGNGPGLIIITEATLDLSKDHSAQGPLPVQQWAEAGYAVAHVVADEIEPRAAMDKSLDDAIDALLMLWTCSDKTRFGVIAYLRSSNPCVPAILQERAGIEATVFFNLSPENAVSPVLAHVPSGAARAPAPGVEQYVYPSTGEFFSIPGHGNYEAASAGLAHTRTLSFLKPLLRESVFE